MRCVDALIAGNPPEVRVARLREFSTMVSANPIWGAVAELAGRLAEGVAARRAVNQASADGSNPLPDEDAATHRDGNARTRLQSHARHEHHGCPTHSYRR